jgi:hypothetical protein
MSAAQQSPDPSQCLTDRGAPRSSARRGLRWGDADVLVALFVLWIASAVRVGGAFARHEVFGAEATLAFMSLVLVPCLFFRARLRSPAPSRSVPPGAPGVRPALRLIGHSGSTLSAGASTRPSANARRRNAEDAEGM